MYKIENSLDLGFLLTFFFIKLDHISTACSTSIFDGISKP